jgi:hypothetical protein
MMCWPRHLLPPVIHQETQAKELEPAEVNHKGGTTEIPSSTPSAVPTLVSTNAPALPTLTSASSLLPSVAHASLATESDEAKRLEGLAAREQQRQERRKRNVRASRAREVGHEVHSDGEFQYWEEWSARDRAEEARRMALSPEVSSAYQMLSGGIAEFNEKPLSFRLHFFIPCA